MMIKEIETKVQHEDALAQIYDLMQMDITEDSKESNELERLSILVEEYEKINYPIPKPNR